MFTAIIRTHGAAGRPITTGTLQRIHAALRAALNAAVRRGLIDHNPARYVELPTDDDHAPSSGPHPRIARCHGVASLSLAAGNDLKTVQDMLGHAGIVLTAEATVRLVLDAARTTAAA